MCSMGERLQLLSCRLMEWCSLNLVSGFADGWLMCLRGWHWCSNGSQRRAMAMVLRARLSRG